MPDRALPERFTAPPDHAPRSPLTSECSGCGACCAAPDIHALHKPLGVACAHLGTDCRCGIYLSRPAVCRNYEPDWVCGEVAPLPTLEARVRRFLRIYGLEDEAATSAGAPT
ncbi:YkgJ family cysteine cluster protein [Deinococcus hohokamensis]|uniref:YkgJ family cysteine cluster protein n=1 Tax=Deinococcus hohokamensis TaxID=309883 RepID=A0ABV9I9R9_9DEIO